MVDPEPNSDGTAFHWHPVRSTCKMPSSTCRNGTTGRPRVPAGFSGGRSRWQTAHSSSGIRQSVGAAVAASWLTIEHLPSDEGARRLRTIIRIGS
jgi:hypothetical protein